MKTDRDLLLEYVSFRSEDAFAELVNRHLGLVYSAALRQVGGDAHMAADVSQRVFTDLAGKAARLPPDIVLPAWLHTGTRYAAAKSVRSEQRRRAYEGQAAHAMNDDVADTSDAEWAQIRPLLDEALAGLGQTDREAVLLRFFQNRSYREIGDQLKIKEDTARVRVERALQRLAELLRRRRIRCAADALGIALLGHAASASVPVGMAQTIAATACATTTSVAGASLGVGAGISLLKVSGVFILGSLTLGLLGLALLELRRETATLRDRALSLQARSSAMAAVSPVGESVGVTSEPAGAEAAAKGLDQFSDRNFLGDSEHGAVAARRHRRYAMGNYRPVIDAMRLSPDETLELKELVATRWLAREDAADLLDRMPDATPEMRRMAATQAEARITQRIEGLLGPDRYAEFTEKWEANREYQINWTLFTEFWDMGEPLGQDQKRGLSQLLAKRRSVVEAILRNNADPNLRETADRQAVEGATALLTPGQREILRRRIEFEARFARAFRD